MARLLRTIPLIVLLTICSGATAGELRASRVAPIPRKTGNLSITSYRPAALQGKPAPDSEPLLAGYQELRRFGFTSIEDYITLDTFEPVRGRVNADYYRRNAAACRRLGLKYAIYPWVHFYPDWVEQEPGFTPYTNILNNQSCRQPSGWAPQTHELVRRFYKGMAAELGASVSAVYVTDCADYGELGYPGGYTKWLRPDENSVDGFWCGDAYARADFISEMLRLYKSVEAINAAWGMTFRSRDEIRYPPPDRLRDGFKPRDLSPQERRRVLDFLYWYQDASARRVKDFIAIAQECFPDRPCEIKLGHGSEAAQMGHSYSSACRILAGTPRLSVRSTHAAVSYMHVKRAVTPARFHGFPVLTEPPGTVQQNRMAERIFTDACIGASAYFDYMQNPRQAGDVFLRNIRRIGGEPARVDVALLFPEADHYLRIQQAYPEGLLECAGAIRDVADYDVVDERLIVDGIMEGYAILVIVGDPLLERTTLERLAAWLAKDPGHKLVQVVESAPSMEPGRFASIDGKDALLGEAPQVSRVIGKPGGDGIVDAVQMLYREILRVQGTDNAAQALLTARDNLWAGSFERRILLYNTSDALVTAGTHRVPGRHIVEIIRKR